MTTTTFTTVVWMLIASASVFFLYSIASALGAIAQALWELHPIGEATKSFMDELQDEQREEAGDSRHESLITIMARLWGRS